MLDKELISKNKQEVEAKGELTKAGVYFSPSVDIYENKESIILLADMPGVSSENIDIHLEDNELRIQGHVVRNKNESPIVEEYRIGDYSRTFTLTNMIDQDKIQATMKDGVLRLELPKAQSVKPKKIAIKTG
ncbi:MAG: Hsp20/alpha crystallin family protein [Desulfobacterales bacterium]|nr:Hsp20/alpha crystallin family protein [Desulfobacterales bacterium]